MFFSQYLCFAKLIANTLISQNPLSKISFFRKIDRKYLHFVKSIANIFFSQYIRFAKLIANTFISRKTFFRKYLLFAKSIANTFIS